MCLIVFCVLRRSCRPTRQRRRCRGLRLGTRVRKDDHLFGLSRHQRHRLRGPPLGFHDCIRRLLVHRLLVLVLVLANERRIAQHVEHTSRQRVGERCDRGGARVNIRPILLVLIVGWPTLADKWRRWRHAESEERCLRSVSSQPRILIVQPADLATKTHIIRT